MLNLQRQWVDRSCDTPRPLYKLEKDAPTRKMVFFFSSILSSHWCKLILLVITWQEDWRFISSLRWSGNWTFWAAHSGHYLGHQPTLLLTSILRVGGWRNSRETVRLHSQANLPHTLHSGRWFFSSWPSLVMTFITEGNRAGCWHLEYGDRDRWGIENQELEFHLCIVCDVTLSEFLPLWMEIQRILEQEWNN